MYNKDADKICVGDNSYIKYLYIYFIIMFVCLFFLYRALPPSEEYAVGVEVELGKIEWSEKYLNPNTPEYMDLRNSIEREVCVMHNISINPPLIYKLNSPIYDVHFIPYHLSF